MSKIQGVVIRVISHKMVAINKGLRDGVMPNMKFLVYFVGEELEDPKTQENLGRIKYPKGRGYAYHVQERISVLKAYREPSILEKQAISLGAIEKPSLPASFDNPKEEDPVEEI